MFMPGIGKATPSRNITSINMVKRTLSLKSFMRNTSSSGLLAIYTPLLFCLGFGGMLTFERSRRLRQLVVTLDDGDGNPVVPADLLSGVTVKEGVNVYCDVDAPESFGQTLTLDAAVSGVAETETGIGSPFTQRSRACRSSPTAGRPCDHSSSSSRVSSMRHSIITPSSPPESTVRPSGLKSSEKGLPEGSWNSVGPFQSA